MATHAVGTCGDRLAPGVLQLSLATFVGQRQCLLHLPKHIARICMPLVAHPQAKFLPGAGGDDKAGARQPKLVAPCKGIVTYVGPLDKFAVQQGVGRREDFRQLDLPVCCGSVRCPQRVQGGRPQAHIARSNVCPLHLDLARGIFRPGHAPMWHAVISPHV